MLSDTASIGLKRAAEILGWEGSLASRRLKRMLLQREREQQRLIMTRRGSPKKWRYYVTMGRLKECCPELFGRGQDETLGAFRKHMLGIDRRLAERDRILRQEIARVRQHSEETRGMVLEVAERLHAAVELVPTYQENEKEPQFIESTQEKRGWFD